MIRLAALFAAVLAVAACSPTGTPTPIGDAPIDLAATERLLTTRDIEAVGASADGLDARTEDIAEIVSLVNPAELEGVDAWFSRSLTSLARPGVLLALRRFDNPARALSELDAIVAGSAFGPMDSVVGDRSALSPGEDGGGAAIAFVSGRTLVVIQCPAASDATTLLDAVQLRALAELVEARL